MSDVGASRRRRWLIVAIVLLPLGAMVFAMRAELWHWAAYGKLQPTAAGTVMFHRRFRWITETRMIHPEQSCPACVREDHDRCVTRTGRIAIWPPSVDYFEHIENPGQEPRTKLRGVSLKGEKDVAGNEVRDITYTMFEGRPIVPLDTGGGVEVESFDLLGLHITPDDFVCPCCE